MSARRRKPASPWAIAACIAGVAVACPLLSISGILLGIAALSDIRSRPDVGGTRLAWAGIIAGIAGIAIWIGAGVWANHAIRQPLLDGPQQPLRAAFAGNHDGFRSAFHGPAADASDAEIDAFVDRLNQRYGPFIAMRQDHAADADPPEPGWLDPVVPYIFEFQRARVRGEAEFTLREGLRLIGKWRSIVIRDDEHGDVYYPEALAPR